MIVSTVPGISVNPRFFFVTASLPRELFAAARENTQSTIA
jgi:hypothetical protein